MVCSIACAKERLVPAAESELTAAVELALGFTNELGSAMVVERMRKMCQWVVRVVVSVTASNSLEWLAW